MTRIMGVEFEEIDDVLVRFQQRDDVMLSDEGSGWWALYLHEKPPHAEVVDVFRARSKEHCVAHGQSRGWFKRLEVGHLDRRYVVKDKCGARPDSDRVDLDGVVALLDLDDAQAYAAEHLDVGCALNHGTRQVVRVQ